MNNSIIKTETSKWFTWALIGVIVVVLVGLFVYITAERDLTSLENFLLQLIFLTAGCSVSFWVGQRSNRKAAEDILKPHARNAVRYLNSLSKGISAAKIIATVGLPQQIESYEDYQFMRGALIATLNEQIGKIDDATESWSDILEKELEDLIRKLQEESPTQVNLEGVTEDLRIAIQERNND